MALDYSKLSDEELQAIQNNDYSKLSDETLAEIMNDPSMQSSPEVAPKVEPEGAIGNAMNAAAGAAAGLYGAGSHALHTPAGQVAALFGGYKAMPYAAKLPGQIAEGVPKAYHSVKDFVSGAGKGVIPPSNIPAGATSSPTWTAPAAPEAPPSASNYMSRMTELADKYLPAKATNAMGSVGRVVAPVARVLGSAPVMGASLMAHSTPLGPQVPSAGPARGSELNPRTGRPWTAQELQAYNAQY